MTKSPYQVIKHRHITEKATMLGSLKDMNSSASLKRFNSPKFVFLVDPSANKHEIANALEEIYKGIKVVSVNTINVKAKARRVRGRPGFKTAFKKAIVTLRPDDKLE